MCLVVGGEDFVEAVFMSLWVIHHDRIMKGDSVISKASPNLRPLRKSFSKLYYIKFNKVGTLH